MHTTDQELKHRHHEKIKSKNNRDRRGRRTPAQSHIKHIQQNHGRKLSQHKEGHTYEGTRSLQNNKEIEPSPYNNQSTKHTE